MYLMSVLYLTMVRTPDTKYACCPDGRSIKICYVKLSRKGFLVRFRTFECNVGESDMQFSEFYRPEIVIVTRLKMTQMILNKERP